MGTVERRKREKVRNEEEIIPAARELFFERGYAATTMGDVAERLELSKGAIYLHFDLKDELYCAVARAGLEIARSGFVAAAAKDKSGLARFFAMGLSYVDFWNEQPGYRRLFHEGTDLASPDVTGPHGARFAALGAELNAMLVRSVRDGISDGSIRPEVSPELVAFCASSSIDGILTSMEKRYTSRRGARARPKCCPSSSSCSGGRWPRTKARSPRSWPGTGHNRWPEASDSLSARIISPMPPMPARGARTLFPGKTSSTRIMKRLPPRAVIRSKRSSFLLFT
jgi:AcrR family transcriptional regulator